jgi:hypothetical protein
MAPPGTVAVSSEMLGALSQRIGQVFRHGGTLEGRGYAVTYKRLDDLFAGITPPPRARGRASAP